jgi:chromate transporter
MALPDTPPLDSPPAHVTPHVPLFALYRTFFWVGLFSFGGGLSAWLHREIVYLRGWMTDEQFFSGYSLSQVMPGVNSSNLSVYIGQHLRGTRGAVVALLGLLTGPFVVVIAAAVAYQYLLGVPGFQAAMAGIAAAAIGMLVRMALTAAHGAVQNAPARGIVPAMIIAITFIAVGILRWPLVPVVLVMAPVSIALAWPRKSVPDA